MADERMTPEEYRLRQGLDELKSNKHITPEEYRLLKGLDAPVKNKPTKYRNIKTEYNGRKYDSKKEARYAEGLDVLLREGLITSWTPQVSWPLRNGHRYRPDFVIKNLDGTFRFVDVKGMDTAASKLKRDSMKADYDIDIELA